MASGIDPLGIPSEVHARPRRLLGDVIVELGFCDRATIEEVVGEARASGRPMGQLLLEAEKLKPHQLSIAIAERFGLQYVDLRGAEPEITAMTLVPEAAVRRLDAVPFGFRAEARCSSRWPIRATCSRSTTWPTGLDGAEEVEVFEAVGCARCGESGYRGRIGLFEVMTVSDTIRGLIVRHATTSEMTRAAIDEGMRPLRQAGLAKVRAGETSLAEVARVAD